VKIKNFQISSFSLYVILMMCIATLVIIWSAHTRMNEHSGYHEDASFITTQKTANEVSNYIREKKRLVHLFAERKSAELWQTLKKPDNDTIYNELLLELKAHFPSIFTFTVTDASGKASRTDFDHLMGKKCVNDLQHFIKTSQQNIRVHPADIYHFDIITDFKHNNQKGILFVSFSTEMISNSLRHAEIPGHQLILSLGLENNLIEVTSEGARNIWIRNDYHLSQKEIERILSTADVNQTEWQVVDMHIETLFSDHNRLIFIQSNLVIAILAVSALLFMILNHREIRRRQKAELVKDEFLSIVSHELRTPLTSIKGAITLIINGATGELNSKTRSVLTIADNNTHRLSSLVNDLLDVQKLESGQMKYKRKLVRPIEFVENAVDSIHSSYFPAPWKININNTLDKELIFADSLRMEQVIANIISNAIKYGSKKDNIDINLTRKNEFVIISVTDYGSGISEETKNQIFEKFTQTKMTDNRHETGSGLGLYIAKIIIEYHGGKITYLSSRGKGTTFYIQLPIITIKKQ